MVTLLWSHRDCRFGKNHQVTKQPPCDSHVNIIWRLYCKIIMTVVLWHVAKWQPYEVPGDFSQSNGRKNFTVESQNQGLLRILKWLYYDIIWWLTTIHRLWWLLSVSCNSKSYESHLLTRHKAAVNMISRWNHEITVVWDQ